MPDQPTHLIMKSEFKIHLCCVAILIVISDFITVLYCCVDIVMSGNFMYSKQTCMIMMTLENIS